MKTLLLMRHAKSSWADPGMPDHDRPLNSRGKHAAPRMGQWLVAQRLTPDLIVASTARRARMTAGLVAEACGYHGPVQVESELYHATPQHWADVVKRLPEPASRVLCVGHNPGLEEVLASWTGADVEMPTAAIAELTLKLDRWTEFDPECGASLAQVQRVKDLDEP